MAHTRSHPRFWVSSLALAIALVIALPASGITFGEPDGNDHPNVGSIVLRHDPSTSGFPDLEPLLQYCSGTLIDDQVFLTASHCTEGLSDAAAAGFEVLVTFDPVIETSGTFFTGEWFTNPAYNGFSGKGGLSSAGDIAVIVLDESPGITPARLPTEGLLDELKASGELKGTVFTAVGYGTVRDSKMKGFAGILDNLDRNKVDQTFSSLINNWVTMSMNPSTGNGGTCYGDSGGPHFIHQDGVETDIVVSVTVTGDAVCKATDKTYRTDTASSREFLGEFVDLP